MNTTPHHAWMAQALDLARQALPDDVPVGALLVRDGQVIAQGFNRREHDCNPVAHAEILALQAAGETLKNWRLSDCTLYVTLEPCPMCMAAILQARIPRVVFGAYDPVMGACGSHVAWQTLTGTPQDIESIGGIDEAACRELLLSFFQQRRSL